MIVLTDDEYQVWKLKYLFNNLLSFQSSFTLLKVLETNTGDRRGEYGIVKLGVDVEVNLPICFDDRRLWAVFRSLALLVPSVASLLPALTNAIISSKTRREKCTFLKSDKNKNELHTVQPDGG